MGKGGGLAGRLARGEVRLCAFDPPDKMRPVLLLTRDSVLNGLAGATIAPITSTIRGIASEVILGEDDGMKAPCAVNLHNVTTISQERLSQRVAQLSPERMSEVCAALAFALGCRGGGN